MAKAVTVLNGCRFLVQVFGTGAAFPFKFEDKMVGTIELTMIKEDKIWKIDELNKPKFDKLNLPL